MENLDSPLIALLRNKEMFARPVETATDCGPHSSPTPTARALPNGINVAARSDTLNPVVAAIRDVKRTPSVYG